MTDSTPTTAATEGLSATVAELRPGDVVAAVPGFPTAVFVQKAQHPIWDHLTLVIWKMPDGSWSHDALDYRQVVGYVSPSTPEQRQTQLRQALLHRSQW